jgi:hypothetical protein
LRRFEVNEDMNEDMNHEDLIVLVKELNKLGYSVVGFSKKDEYPQERITLELIGQCLL